MCDLSITTSACVRALFTTHDTDIKSCAHNVTTDLVRKVALSTFGDKRVMITGDPLHRTFAWFHKDIDESLLENCDTSGRVKVVNTPLKW